MMIQKKKIKNPQNNNNNKMYMIHKISLKKPTDSGIFI